MSWKYIHHTIIIPKHYQKHFLYYHAITKSHTKNKKLNKSILNKRD